MIGLPYGEKNYDDMLSRFHTIPACHGRTDGRTELLYQYRASAAGCWRAIKTVFMLENIPLEESWILSQHFWCILGSSLLCLRAMISFCSEKQSAVSGRLVQTANHSRVFKTNKDFYNELITNFRQTRLTIKIRKSTLNLGHFSCRWLVINPNSKPLL